MPATPTVPGYIGSGITLYYSSNLGHDTNMTRLAYVYSFSGAETTMEETDMSNHDSNMIKQMLPSWQEAGKIDIVLIYNKTDFNTVRSICLNRSIYDWVVQMPAAAGSSQIQLTGYIISTGVEVPLKDKITQKFSLRAYNGIINFAP